MNPTRLSRNCSEGLTTKYTKHTKPKASAMDTNWPILLFSDLMRAARFAHILFLLCISCFSWFPLIA